MRVNRKSARLMQVLVFVLALALIFTTVPVVLWNHSPKANAAEPVHVNSYDQLKSYLSGTGDVHIILDQTISLSGGAECDRQPRLSISAGKNVTLDLNGHKIEWRETSKGVDLLSNQALQLNYAGYQYVLIDNAGTLNIIGESGSIDVYLASTNVSTSKNPFSGSACAIRNSGKLETAEGISISTYFQFETVDGNARNDVYLTSIGIYQTAGSMLIRSNIKVDSKTIAASKTPPLAGAPNGPCNFNVAYGIYGQNGTVVFDGGNNSEKKTITVDAYAGFKTGSKGNSESRMMQIAMGVYTTSSDSKFSNVNITVSGTGDANANGSNQDNLKGHNDELYIIGIGYPMLLTNTPPTLSSTTSVTTLRSIAHSNSNSEMKQNLRTPIREVTKNPLNMFDTTTGGFDGSNGWATDRNVGCATNNNTNYRDETGNRWTVGTDENASISGGVPSTLSSSVSKVEVLYRLFDSQGNIEHVLTGNNNYINGHLSLSNVSTGRAQVGNKVSYLSGGSPYNNNFYKPTSLKAMLILNSSMSSQNIYQTALLGATDLANATEEGFTAIADAEITATANQTIIVYADYRSVSSSTLSMRVNNDQYFFQSAADKQQEQSTPKVTLPYTGEQIQINGDPSKGFKVDIAREDTNDSYSMGADKFQNDTIITSSFGTPLGSGARQVNLTVKKDGQEGDLGGLPTDAGTYHLTLQIDDETTYNKDPNLAGNFKGSSFQIDVVIEPKMQISQQKNLSLVYGTKLSEITQEQFRECFDVTAHGLGDANVEEEGTYSFAQSSEMPQVPDQGLREENPKYELRWTPTDPQKYKTCTLEEAEVEPTKKPVTITPNDKSIIHGGKLAVSQDEISFEGVLDSDKLEVYGLIRDSLVVSSDYSSGYAPYDAETPLEPGDYYFKFNVAETKNYTITNAPGNLKILPDAVEFEMELSLSGTLVEGNVLTPIIGGVPEDAIPYLRYAWYRVDEEGKETFMSSESTYLLTSADVGYYIKLVVSVAPASPFIAEKKEAKTDGPIQEIRLSFWERLMKWVFSIFESIQGIFDSLGRIR